MDLLIVRSICTTVSGPHAGQQSHINPLRDLGQCNCKREQAPGPGRLPYYTLNRTSIHAWRAAELGGETIPHFLTVFVFNQANNSLVSFPLAPAASDSGGKGCVCFCVRTAEHRCNYTGVILWHASVLHGKCLFLFVQCWSETVTIRLVLQFAAESSSEEINYAYLFRKYICHM